LASSHSNQTMPKSYNSINVTTQLLLHVGMHTQNIFLLSFAGLNNRSPFPQREKRMSSFPWQPTALVAAARHYPLPESAPRAAADLSGLLALRQGMVASVRGELRFFRLVAIFSRESLYTSVVGEINVNLKRRIQFGGSNWFR
jgi:hypothetical protein